MRPLRAMRSTRLSLSNSSSAPNLQQTWRPQDGIRFGSTVSSPTAANSLCQPSNGLVFGNNNIISYRTSRTTGTRPYSGTTGTNDEDLALHSFAEDSYVLAGSFDPLAESRESIQSTNRSTTCGGKSHQTPSHDEPRHGQFETSLSRQSVTPDNVPRTVDAQAQEPAEAKEEHPELEFQIPATVFEEAKNASPDKPDSYWSHRLYSGNDERKVTVHYCRSLHTTEQILQSHFMDKKVLGFDIEWRPGATSKSGIKSNVALVQLGCEDRIALFHLALFSKEGVENIVAPSLKKIMEDPNITKAGVAIKGDCTRMKTYLEIDSKGMFELSHLYKLVKHSQDGKTELINKRLVSLAEQVEEHLELPLYKGDTVRGSDWSQALDMDQLMYAASDSYAGFRLYDVMEAKRKQLSPTPPRPHLVERELPIRLASDVEVTCFNKLVAQQTDLETDKKSSKASRPKLAPKVSTNASTSRSGLPENTLKVQLVIGSEAAANGQVKSTAKRLAKASRSMVKLPEHEMPPALRSATAWAAALRRSQDIGRGRQFLAGQAQLRAYALWQREGISIEEIIVYLDVQKRTVVSYILEAIRIEKLPFENSKITKLLEMLPDNVKGTPRGRLYMRLLAEDKPKAHMVDN